MLSYGSRLTAPFRLVGDFIPVCPLAFGAFRVRLFLPHPLPPFPLLPLWVCGGDRHKAEVKTAILGCLLFLQAKVAPQVSLSLAPNGKIALPIGD